MSNWNKNDLKRQFEKAISDGWVSVIQATANDSHTTAQWLAIGSRETNLRNLIGDNGNGFGVWQIDKRFESDFTDKFATSTIKAQLKKAISIYDGKVAQIGRLEGKNFSLKSRGKTYRATGKKVDNVDKRRIATAAYNCGLWGYRQFSVGKDIDSVSSHKDYGKDVYKRAIIFAQFLEEWGIEDNALAKEIEAQGKYFKGKKSEPEMIKSGKPKIKQASYEKICEYALGKEWQSKYPIMMVAIRNPQSRRYDGEMALMNFRTGDYDTFWWNTEPARKFNRKGRGTAHLVPQFAMYTLSYHHKWSNETRRRRCKRSIALRPKTKNELLPCFRFKRNGRDIYYDNGQACNCHIGGHKNSHSEGCQTCHPRNYDEIFFMIAKALGVKLPTMRVRGKTRILRPVKRANQALMDGIGEIPYFLMTQKQFNYIVNLPREEFDSDADLAWQAKNFANMPKFGQQVVKELAKEFQEIPQDVIDTEDEAIKSEAQNLIQDAEVEHEETEEQSFIPASVSNAMPSSLVDAQEKMVQAQGAFEQGQRVLEQATEMAGKAKEAVTGGSATDPTQKASRGSGKSAVTTGGGGGVGIGTMVKGFYSDNETLIIVGAVLVGVCVVVYLTRQIWMDTVRMWIHSNPDKQNTE